MPERSARERACTPPRADEPDLSAAKHPLPLHLADEALEEGTAIDAVLRAQDIRALGEGDPRDADLIGPVDRVRMLSGMRECSGGTWMDGIATTVHFVHVASGAAWLGGSLFANLFLVPFALRQPIDSRRGLIESLLLGPERMMIGAALLVVVTGLLRGITLGPITSLEALGRPYGVAWLLSLIIVAMVFVTGGRVTGPAIHRLTREDDR